MRNPWVHDDEEVTVSTEDGYRSNIQWIGVVVWVSLAVLVAALVIFAGGQLTVPPPDQLVSMLLTAFGGLLFLLVAVPVLFKLLRISRLLTALVAFGSLGLGGRYLILNNYLFAKEHQILTESAGGRLQEAIELFEALTILA